MKGYNLNESRLAEYDEIRKASVTIDLSGDYVAGAGIPIVSDGRVMMVDNTDHHSLIVGATASGKTLRVVLPLIESCRKAGNSMVIHDSKGELYSLMKPLLEEANYNVRILNFKSPMQGDYYNLLYYPAKLYHQGDRSKAVKYFHDLGATIFSAIHSEKDLFWENAAVAYFKGLCILLCELLPAEEISLDKLYQVYLEGTERTAGNGSYFQRYYKGIKDKPESYGLIYPTEESAAETRGSVYAVMGTPLTQFAYHEELVDMMSDSNWDIEEIAENKTAIFLITDTNSSLMQTITAAMIQQIYQVLVDYADAKKGGRLERRVEFILDEFATMAPLQDIQKKMADSRSRNIRFHLSVQSLAQLSYLYGREQAKIIMGNCTNWIYLYSSDLELLKMISERTGFRHSKYTNEYRPLISVEALSHFNKEEGEVLFLGRTYPFVSYLPMFFNYANAREAFPVDKISCRERHSDKLFSFKRYVDKMIGYEHMKESLQVFDPLFDINAAKDMLYRGKPEQNPGYLLFATEEETIFCNRINDDRKYKIFCTFQYGTYFVLGYHTGNEAKEIKLALYEPRLRYSCLHELPEDEEETIMEALMEAYENLNQQEG